MTKRKEQIELMKCRKDIVYFAETYICISSFHGVPTKLYPFQKQMLKDFKDNAYNDALMARQMGASTIHLIFALYTALFNQNRTIMILSPKESMGKTEYSKLHKMCMMLPLFLQYNILNTRRSCVEFTNGSKIIFDSMSADRQCGCSVDILILDNIDHICNVSASESGGQSYPLLDHMGSQR